MISRLILLAASVSAIGLALPLYQHLVFIVAPIYFWIVGVLLYLAKGVFVMTQVRRYSSYILTICVSLCKSYKISRHFLN